MSHPADLQPGSGVGRSKQLISPALAVLAICLILGTFTVVWRAWASADAERVRAQAQAMGRGAAIELQFSRALRATEILGAMARQSGGAIPDFQRAAAEIHAAFPELASLELQPGGIVSDIVPRTGNERAIGFNVFKDPAYRAGATAALQSRTPYVVAPLILYGGQPGLVVRVPVFQKGTGSQNQFWGFVATSMPLSEALRRAGLGELSKLGYDYILFAAGSAPGRTTAITMRGIKSLHDTVQQPIRVQNVEFRLALRRQGGWISKSKVLLECSVVIVTSCVLFCLASAITSRRRLEVDLGQAHRQLVVETAEREKAQGIVAEARASGQHEVANLRSALEQANAEIARRTQALSIATESQQVSEASLKQVQLSVGELQARLDRTAQSHEKELAANQADLADARAKLETANQKVRELEGALVMAQHAERAATAAIQAEQAKAQATIADLQAQLETQKVSVRKDAQAAAARLEQIEAVNQELGVALAEAQRTQVEASEPEAQPGAGETAAAAGAETVTVSEPPVNPVSVEAEPGRLDDPPLEAAPLPATANPEVESTPAAPGEALSSPPVEQPSSLPKKRKRTRNKDRMQIELFGDTAPPEQPEAETSREAAVQIGVIDSSQPPAEEPGRAEAAAASSGEEEPVPEVPPTEEIDTPGADAPRDSITDLKPEVRSGENRPVAAHRSAPTRPVDAAQLRLAANQILPLLVDQDPGAKDCFKANRPVFRSAFPMAVFEEFEKLVKSGDFEPALEQLRKAARKHGIHI